MSAQKLTVLITNIHLSGRSGTEIVTRDLALGLRQRGYFPIVYTQAGGPIAQELERASIPVYTEIAKLVTPVDLIHGHHTPVIATAVSRFPDKPAIFIAHDFLSWFDEPPNFSSIMRYCAVDTTVAGRLAAQEWLDPSNVSILLNAVDTNRFRQGPRIADKPVRALAFAKNTGHIKAIQEACDRRQIRLDVVGAAVGNLIDSPETTLHQYDLVFASALSAIEAMTTGRAVLVCDGRGMAGMVTPERLPDWRPRNFGLGCLSRPVTVEGVLEELELYDAQQTDRVTSYMRENANQVAWLDRIEDLYAKAVAAYHEAPSPTSTVEISNYLEAWTPRLDDRWPWLAERHGLVEMLNKAWQGIRRPVFGERLSLTAAAKDDALQRVSGFCDPETWGVWTAAETAVLVTRMPEGSAQDSFSVILEVQAFVPPTQPTLEVSVIVNGHEVAIWKFGVECSFQTNTIRLSRPNRSEFDQLWLSFQIREPRSPLECGVNGDGRRIGLGIISVTFLDDMHEAGSVHDTNR